MRNFEDEPRLWPISSLLREPVKNLAGEKLGEIRDVVLDPEKGCIAYAILSFGGLFGLGKRMFVVPWRALKFDEEEESFCLDIPRERLEGAPAFDSDDWPDVSDRQWGNEVHRYFDARPYWEHDNERERNNSDQQVGRRTR